MSLNYDQKKLHLLKTGEEVLAKYGFTGLGLSKLLQISGIPKGSFYYYFSSKEEYGVAVIEYYIAQQLAYMKSLFSNTNFTMREKLIRYWKNWYTSQCLDECKGRCLIVKLSCEVADFSTSMRIAFCKGIDQIIVLLCDAITQGQQDGTISETLNAQQTAKQLYQQWLGASLVVKLQHREESFAIAMELTESIL